MALRQTLTWFCFVSVCATALAETPLIQIEPYALPDKEQQSLGELAAETDVLILGEMHGMQEVPAVAVALLEPLTKLGYGALALEIPASDRDALTNWAIGKTVTIPEFFAHPWPDGRANIQVLVLIRAALSPSHNWKLMCFDMSEEDAADFVPQPDQNEKQNDSDRLDDGIALFVKRDAKMASHLSRQRSVLAGNSKVLAICGGMHARTAQAREAGDAKEKTSDASMNKFWPSFAAQLATSHPNWRVHSINVVPHSGGFFAMMSVEGEPDPTSGKVHPIRSSKRLDAAELRPLSGAAWDWQLDLPRATPATFLATPSIPATEG
jgi:hypothetical protein